MKNITAAALAACVLSALLLTMALFPSYSMPITRPVSVPESRQKANYLYVPRAPNAPLLKEKNDISAQVLGSFGIHHTALALQAAFLPTKHLGLVAGYTTGYNKGGDNQTQISYRQWEAGAGYVTSVGESWWLETYAGFGAGSIVNTYATGSSTVKNTCFFIQPTFFFISRKDRMRLGLLSKLTGQRFDVNSTSFAQDREYYSAWQIQLISDKPLQLFLEEGLVFRFGGQQVRFHAGFTISTDLSSAELHCVRENLTAGVLMLFNTGKKRRGK